MNLLNSVVADLRRQAESRDGSPLLVDGTARLTYGDVWRAAQAISAFLSSKGIGRGDRVGVLMSKTHEQPLAQFGVMAAGAVMVPMSDLLKADQVQYMTADCGLKALIVDYDKIDRMGSMVEGLVTIVAGPGSAQGYSHLESIMENTPAGRVPDMIGQDSAAIIYSSGSTGRPKGIVLSHRNLWDGARITSHYLGLRADDRLAQILSYNFDYGLNQLFGAIHVGAQVHLHSFQFPKDVFTFLRESQITTLALMPVFLNRLFDKHFYKPAFSENIASLRRITTSGGRLPSPTIDAMRQAFPAADIYLMYGLTEAFRSTYLEPGQIDIRRDSIGKAIPEVEILILDENGNECPPGVPGELVHRGGVIAKGYWNAPEKTAERFRQLLDASGNPETVVYSGDIVRRDSEGYLYFIGRRDNMIKTSGHRVSPEEVEHAVEAIPGIRDAVVFSREHDVLGEEIICVCAYTGGGERPDERAVRTFLNKRLASYMVPRVILFADDFGVTAGNQGKIDRSGAKEFALDQLKGK